MKYKEWLNDWLELYEKESVKPRTYKQYEDVINKRLIPALGDYEMEDLTPIILQRYIVDLSQKGNTMTGKGLAPNSVNCIILVLHSYLSMAYVLGLTKEIHVDKIKRPKTSEKPVESFTKEEQKMIEQAVLSDKRGNMFGVILCLYTGLRIGELLALEWSDIDFIKTELSVTKTCYDGQDENGKSFRITGTPKTETSKRIIPIPKQLIPHLREIKKRSTTKYVVGNGSKIITVRSYQRSFELLLQKHKISHHGFHALRHTFATRAVECGMEDFEKYYDRVDIPISAHPKLAITKRNEWMAEQADLILCYIERESGGACKAVQYARKLRKEVINLAKKTKKIDMNPKQLWYDLHQAYRRLTWKIWVYLKANPDVLESNENREIFDEIGKIQTQIFMRRYPEHTYEEAFNTQDFLSYLEAKHHAEDFYFEQELMDLFRPSTPHDKEWKWKVFVELFFFSANNERYTKTK